MKTLGTILPTSRSMAVNEAWFDARQVEMAKTASEHPMLNNAEQRRVAGETRFYLTPTIYAISPLSGSGIKWFEVRSDGDYSISQKQAESML